MSEIPTRIKRLQSYTVRDVINYSNTYHYPFETTYVIFRSKVGYNATLILHDGVLHHGYRTDTPLTRAERDYLYTLWKLQGG